MKQSLLFTKTRREDPKDETAKNAKLLIRGGYIHKELAGVYTYLPLGLLVLKNIEAIIREEIEKIGGLELQLTSLQTPEIWQKTDRFSDEIVDVWFKTKLKNNTELGLAFTHEEPLTNLLKSHINSYRDLPIYLYQIQTKFRNEIRAKSGILRGREFIMKDLYSFTKDQSALDTFYEKAKVAYHNIFRRVGLGDSTYLTFASGGVFSPYSHEFQTVCEAGEDIIYISDEKGIAVNKEVYNDEVLTDLGLKASDLREVKAVEVGNIFKLGTKFSEALDLFYLDEVGKKHFVVMGSYGIGLGRLLGTVIEVLSPNDGIVWPKSITPFLVHLLPLGDNPEVKKQTEVLYKKLIDQKISVLYDDRSLAPGEKLAEADLLGMSYRVVISEKTIAEEVIEVLDRNLGQTSKLPQAEFIAILNNEIKK